MTLASKLCLASLAALAAALPLGCQSHEIEAPSLLAIPRPTEHLLDADVESNHKSLRKAWISDMHRTAPDIDWQAIERANGRREMERRTELQLGSQFAGAASNWTEVGSRNQAGRMHCATLSPDATMLYAGSSLGGIWRGNIDGTNWVPLGDNLQAGGRHIVALPGEQSMQPDVIVAATGNNQIWVTRDDGATWEAPLGLPGFSKVRKVILLKDAAPTILVLGRANNDSVIYASTDYGRSFQARWTGTNAWDSSMWVPRYGAGSDNTIYLLHRGRIRKSTDGGMNFSLIATIDAGADEGYITGSEAGGPTLYASLKANSQWKLYRSDDGGVAWNFVFDMVDYWGALEASSSNPNLVSYGGVEARRSTNGGANFSKINTWGAYYGDPAHKLHADLQGINCFPNPSTPGISDLWYFCTDGGIYLSTDGTQTVNNLCLSGLGVSQYYSTHTSSADNTHISAGSQDQGYQRGIFQPSTGPGPSTNFDQLISGDYGHLTSSDGTHDLVYSTYPGFILIQDGETNPVIRTTEFPPGADHLWLPPVVADPTSNGAFFFLGDQLFRYTQVSTASWTNTVHSNETFSDGSASYLSAMAFAPTNSNRVYAVNNRGRLYSSTDHGVNWALAVGDGPDSHYFYGNTVAVNPEDELEAFIGGSGYSNGAVRRTSDGGATWHEMSNGLPSTLVYDLAYSSDGSGDVYAAAEAGAWHWDSTTELWENIMQSFTPLTTYWSIEAVPGLSTSEAAMRFGTYGRGIWDYAIPIGTNGTWEVYDENASPVNVLSLASETPPNIGTTIQFDISGGLISSGTGWILAGRQRGNLPLFGGIQLVDVVVRSFSFPVQFDGTGTRTLPLPNNPAFLGLPFRFQAVIPDIAHPGGHALSNGLEAVFGY